MERFWEARTVVPRMICAGDYVGAEQVLLSAVDEVERKAVRWAQAFGRPRLVTDWYHEQLVELYRTQGRPERAERVRARYAAIPKEPAERSVA